MKLIVIIIVSVLIPAFIEAAPIRDLIGKSGCESTATVWVIPKENVFSHHNGQWSSARFPDGDEVYKWAPEWLSSVVWRRIFASAVAKYRKHFIWAKFLNIIGSGRHMTTPSTLTTMCPATTTAPCVTSPTRRIRYRYVINRHVFFPLSRPYDYPRLPLIIPDWVDQK